MLKKFKRKTLLTLSRFCNSQFKLENIKIKISNSSLAKIIRIYENQIRGDNMIIHPKHQSQVACILKLNSTQIASGGYDCSIKIWNFVDGLCLKNNFRHN